MTIKSLLIGSAAAIVAVSGAQAADAIVAAEPEAVEYVRVCDAFGAGFFYIPGSETCLKLSGFVRFQTNFANKDLAGTSEWNSFTRAQVNFDARTETDLGVLRSFIAMRGQPESGDKTTGGVWLEEAYLEVAGLRAGKFYSFWDASLSGETDELASNSLFNSVMYTYDAGAFTIAAAVDELQLDTATDNNVGVALQASAKIAAIDVALLGSYDVDAEEGAVRVLGTAQVGPGVLGVSGIWASGANAYYAKSEWTVAAEYAVNVTEKLKVAPGVQYFNNVAFADGVDALKVGVTADYAITSGLSAKAHFDYKDEDGKAEAYTGFVRLQRSF
jgi:hypothetical protein